MPGTLFFPPFHSGGDKHREVHQPALLTELVCASTGLPLRLVTSEATDRKGPRSPSWVFCQDVHWLPSQRNFLLSISAETWDPNKPVRIATSSPTAAPQLQGLPVRLASGSFEESAVDRPCQPVSAAANEPSVILLKNSGLTVCVSTWGGSYIGPSGCTLCISESWEISSQRASGKLQTVASPRAKRQLKPLQ